MARPSCGRCGRPAKCPKDEWGKRHPVTYTYGPERKQVPLCSACIDDVYGSPIAALRVEPHR